jgi:hypothetical protein
VLSLAVFPSVLLWNFISIAWILYVYLCYTPMLLHRVENRIFYIQNWQTLKHV